MWRFQKKKHKMWLPSLTCESFENEFGASSYMYALHNQILLYHHYMKILDDLLGIYNKIKVINLTWCATQ